MRLKGGQAWRNVRHGFTLVEMLVTLGLIILLTTVFIVSAEPMLDGLSAPPPETILRQAVREARILSLENKTPVELSFSEEDLAFTVRRIEGESEIARFPTELSEDDDFSIVWRVAEPFQGIQPGSRQNWAEADGIRFHPDHSSPYFEVQMTEGRLEQMFRFDAFSPLEIIEEDR